MARKTKDRTGLDLWTHRDASLWGNADITGFDVEATDGSIGTVDEANFEAGSSHIVVDTGPWIFGKKVVLPAGLIRRVDLGDRRVWLDLTKSQIENAPEFDELRYHDDDYRAEIGAYYGDDTSTDTDVSDGEVLERREERMTVDKDTQQVGSVRVGKRVVQETQSVDVPVTREELVIERRAVDRPAGDADLTEGAVEVPVYEEQVRTGKDVRVVEELEIGKASKTDTERVSGTVRREEFDIDDDRADVTDTTRR